MSRCYPWYDVVASDVGLLQGDMVRECPYVMPTPEVTDGRAKDRVHDVEVSTYNVIVMSQSCDLVQRKVAQVLVCPFRDLTDFAHSESFYRSPKNKNALRKGNVVGYHLLNRCTINEFETDYLVVDFRNVFGVPFAFLCDLARGRDKRLRLLPPYREHLSQAFARFIMRVGLPVDIPSFR